MSELWVEKYGPKKLADVVGQPVAIHQMREWANGWLRRKPSKKAILLYGGTGTGKSAAASALAQEFGWDILEMNASDERTLNQIKRVAGAAAISWTLVGGAGGMRLVVLDEADNVHGTADRGGYKAIKEVIEEARNPIILIANDQYSIPWDIRASCLAVGFRRLNKDVVMRELLRVAKAEGISLDVGAADKIAETSEGDLRSAIQDLQVLSAGRKALKVDDVLRYSRDRKKNIFDLIKGILSARSAAEIRELSWAVDMPPEDILAWVEENIPKMVADPEARARVCDAISRADIFLSRAKRKQAYGLWGYASDIMTAGVSLNRGEMINWDKFQPPSHIRRFAHTRGLRAIRDSAAGKVARRCHTSARVARRDVLPYLSVVLKHDKKAETISAELELSEEELAFLTSTV
ncbi:MAG: replication factor C large subunit [Candidatus Hadarchaeota archaeon]